MVTVREVSRITEKAMRGDFDFEESLRQRVASAALGKTRLSHIFHLLGITGEDISEALSCRS